MERFHYRVGDIVTYNAFSGEERTVVVIRKAMVTNGREGFDGIELGTNLKYWGYTEQIKRVQHRRKREDHDYPNQDYFRGNI